MKERKKERKKAELGGGDSVRFVCVCVCVCVCVQLLEFNDLVLFYSHWNFLYW